MYGENETLEFDSPDALPVPYDFVLVDIDNVVFAVVEISIHSGRNEI